MLPPAPPTFSTTTDCPSVVRMRSAMMRATTSVEPPGGKGEMIVIGRDGYGCACTAATAPTKASAKITTFIDSSRAQSDLPGWDLQARPEVGPLVLDERPGRHVEIVGHGDVHEAAGVVQRARDVSLAGGVLGEDQVTRPADEARPFARLDLQDPGGEEDELAPRRVVKILHVAFRRLAEEQRTAGERLRHRPRAAHRHLAQLDPRFSGRLGVDPEDAHGMNDKVSTSLFLEEESHASRHCAGRIV